MKSKKKTQSPPPPIVPDEPTAKSLENTIARLQEKIRILSHQPGDFRDLEPGSVDWNTYRDLIPQAHEGMDKWLTGPVMCYGLEPSEEELNILSQKHQKIGKMILHPQQIGIEEFIRTVTNLDATGYSYIYLRGFPPGFDAWINYIASFFKLKIRAMHQFLP